MRFAFIKNNMVLGVCSTNDKLNDYYYRITKEQFECWSGPCYADIIDGIVVFGDVVPWDEVPDTSMVVEENPEPIIEEPTQLDQIEAQVTYTAIMTDTLLEV